MRLAAGRAPWWISPKTQRAFEESDVRFGAAGTSAALMLVRQVSLSENNRVLLVLEGAETDNKPNGDWRITVERVALNGEDG